MQLQNGYFSPWKVRCKFFYCFKFIRRLRNNAVFVKLFILERFQFTMCLFILRHITCNYKHQTCAKFMKKKINNNTVKYSQIHVQS